MSRARPNDWASLGLDLWLLGLESSAVMGLRALKLAAGGAAANREAQLMVSEKFSAATDITQRAALGQVGAAGAVAHYRRKVRSNLKRLSKS